MNNMWEQMWKMEESVVKTGFGVAGPFDKKSAEHFAEKVEEGKLDMGVFAHLDVDVRECSPGSYCVHVEQRHRAAWRWPKAAWYVRTAFGALVAYGVFYIVIAVVDMILEAGL